MTKKNEYPLWVRVVMAIITAIDFVLLIPYHIRWCIEFAWLFISYPFYFCIYHVRIWLSRRRVRRSYRVSPFYEATARRFPFRW